jgi:hypothetical protein
MRWSTRAFISFSLAVSPGQVGAVSIGWIALLHIHFTHATPASLPLPTPFARPPDPLVHAATPFERWRS